MSWEIMLGIIALVGFLGTVSTWVWKLAGTLTKLTEGLKSLSEFKNSANTEHEEIKGKIAEHDGRIETLEYKTGIKR